MKTPVRPLAVEIVFLTWSLAANAQTSGEPAQPKPEAPASEPAASATKAELAQEERLRALENEVKRLSEELAAERAVKIAPPAKPSGQEEGQPPAPPKSEGAQHAGQQWFDVFRGLVISSYVQAQYENHAESEDQLRQGGALLNQNRFLIRRARLKIEREWEFSSVMVELDGNTTRGPAFSLHHAEAALQWRGDNVAPSPPMVRLTLGLFDVPFGYELVESPRARLFMERSLASRDFFPAEPDLGVRLSGDISWFRYAFAVVNGEPNGVVNGFPLQDPNNAKDLVLRIGANVKDDDLEISGDVSVLSGRGFVKGTDAVKNTVIWNDSMPADGNLRPSELAGVPAVAATASRNFRRWLLGADLKVRKRWSPGWTQLYGEFHLASNMDRGQFVANPTLTSEVRELGFYAGLTQEITPFFVLGFRADYYDPNADSTDTQMGKLVPSNQRVVTYSPLVGAQLPGRARLVFQYDIIRDHLARDSAGVPTDLRNDTWTLRMQGEL